MTFADYVLYLQIYFYRKTDFYFTMNRYFLSATLFLFIALACVFRAQGSVAGASEVQLTVSDGGRMNLVSGSSIILKPGVRVVAGGYLRAAIIPGPVEQKTAIHKSRNHQKTADAETAITPIVIAETHDAISPFAKRSVRGISENDNKEESLVAQISEVSGISPGQNHKLAAYSSATRMNLTWNRITESSHYRFIPLSENHETIAVLRL